MAVITPKKRGRPAGTRKKHVPTVESVREEWEKRYMEMFQRCDAMFDQYRSTIGSLELKVKNLEHQAIGYDAVISYLEHTIERLISNPVRGN